MGYTWKDYLKDSSWVTIAWEWLQSLLGRTVDFVLWVTMIFACYQLIPGAPMPDQSVSVFMFVMQFIALDIGGMSLNQIGQRHGLGTWSYTRVVAYACILVTLSTIVFAGIQHATTVEQNITNWVEIILVIARSILTVLYGQAVRAIKFVEQEENDKVANLEQEVSRLTVQLNTEQKRVSDLQNQLDNERQKVSSVQLELDRQVSNLVSSGQREVSSVQLELDRALAEVSRLTVQLEAKDQQLISLQDTLESGMKLHENSAQQIVSSVQKQLDKALVEVSNLQEQVSTGQQQVSKLRIQLDNERARASNLQEQLNSQKESGIQQQVSSVQSERVQLDTRKNGQEGSENAIVEQIRAILSVEPGLSARAIAARIGCSPTTASTWKKAVEQELSIVPKLHVVNE